MSDVDSATSPPATAPEEPRAKRQKTDDSPPPDEAVVPKKKAPARRKKPTGRRRKQAPSPSASPCSEATFDSGADDEETEYDREFIASAVEHVDSDDDGAKISTANIITGKRTRRPVVREVDPDEQKLLEANGFTLTEEELAAIEAEEAEEQEESDASSWAGSESGSDDGSNYSSDDSDDSEAMTDELTETDDSDSE